jgi:small redox-active disulfide protein 2
MRYTMKVEIYGTGCPKCKKLFENAQEAVKISGVDADVVKVEDINEIMNAGIMMTPAIAIDGEIKSSGKLLAVDDIKDLLT